MNEKSNAEMEKHMEEILNKLELELESRYCQMGKSVLEMADCEKPVINHLVDEIIEMKRQLAVVKEEIECPQCMILNTHDSTYCKHCGELLDKADKGKEQYHDNGSRQKR